MVENLYFFLIQGEMRIDFDICVAQQIIHICAEILRNLRERETIRQAAVFDIAVYGIWIEVQIIGEPALGDALFGQKCLNACSNLHGGLPMDYIHPPSRVII